MFKEYGQKIKTADGDVILEVSAIVSCGISGNHCLIQTQMRPPEDIWRTAVLFETEMKFQMSCTKWIFSFQPHADGGYEHMPRSGYPIALDTDSSGLIADMLRRYRELKRNC